MASTKMDTAGRLAGGVAHEFNNLLTAIGGYADLVLERLPDDESLRGDVREIKRAAERASSLTRQLLAFSRKQMLAPQVLDLEEVLPTFAEAIAETLGEEIPLKIVTGTDVGPVRADPRQMESVLLELAANAREAMVEGGRLTIETANETIDETLDLAHDRLEPGRYVRISVSDTGDGMAPSILANCFEPFYTTRPTSTGMGLSTIFGIVKQSGGAVTAASEPGMGSRIDVFLPRSGDTALLPTTQAPAPATAEVPETVLLVEDEGSVRSLVEKVLRRQGYTVLSAEHAGDALILSETHPGPIDLLLTDVVMPQMSGPELSEWLQPLRPEMRVLFMSGYTDDSIAEMGALEPGTSFIHKPFSTTSIADKVREVLAAPPCTAPPLC